MSRSKHTRPYPIIAAARVQSPYEHRSEADQSARNVVGRILKELGLSPIEPSGQSATDGPMPLPRIVIRRPRQDRIQPLSRSAIVDALRFFGEVCAYGLRSISLVNGP